MALIALAALAASVAVEAAPRVARIHYAEPVTLPDLPSLPAAGTQKPTGAVHTGFEAFGRRYDLQLEPNDRVLRKLSPVARAMLPAHALYAGTVVGLPGSWVRITRLDSGVQGLVFDGNDLYVLAPAAAVRSELDIPIPGLAETATVIYRAADVDSGLGPDFCRVLAPPGSGSATSGGTAEPAYKAIFAELATNASSIASALPSKELDLALIGDTQLAAAIPGTIAEMLARLNNVDGIFSAQVGVRITSGFVKVLTNNGGMTATAADQLLDQVDAYRRVTPEAASRGVAHLMTGRDLDGTTIGIAYLGTLCATQFAVSLSQTYLDTYSSSLVAAHELGHNFGAPHDGVSGTACASTAQTYLMAPAINGNSAFSQCSLDQMAPHVASAACLTAPHIADVGVEIASTTLSAYTKQDVHVPVDVVSNGTLTVDQVVLTLSPNNALQIVSTTVSGGSCTSNGVNTTCQLGSLAAGTRRQADVVVRSNEVGPSALSANVSASVDADPGDNGDFVQVTFTSPADGSITASPSSVTAYAGQALPFSVTATNAGPLALENAAVVIQKPAAYSVSSVSGAGATCVVNALDATCTLGSLPAGASRRIDVNMVGTRAWSQSVQATIQSSNDSIPGNDHAFVALTALPLVELTVTADAGPSVIPLGGTVAQSFTLHSTGPQPVSGATFTLMPSGGAEIASVSGAGAACASVSGTRSYRCTYDAPIESGGTRHLDAQLRGATLGAARVAVTVTAPDSQHLPGSNVDSVVLDYAVKSLVDVRLNPSAARFGFDHRPTLFVFDVVSNGASPAPGTQFTLQLPAGVHATTANPNLGSCTIGPAVINCTLGTVPAGLTGRVLAELVSDVPGTYTLSGRAHADGDTDATNDSATVDFIVQPYLDVGLEPLPADPHVRAGGTLDYTVALRSATQPVTGVIAIVTANSGITIVSATPSQGSCDPLAAQVRCTFGNVPANGVVTVVVRVRGDVAGQAQLRVDVSATGDADGTNNTGIGTVFVDQRGDVAVQSAAARVAATVGTSFDYPGLTVHAVTRSDDVRVGLTVPTTFSVENVTADGAPCSVNAGSVSCTFGTLEAGVSRGIALRLRPNQAGTFTVSESATAADDSDTSNNSASVTITVSKSASGSSGGGGGGSLDRDSLFLMLMLAPAVVRRRRGGAV